jgi:hypothetical protein
MTKTHESAVLADQDRPVLFWSFVFRISCLFRISRFVFRALQALLLGEICPAAAVFRTATTRVLTLCQLLVFGVCCPAVAQPSWEFSPYRIRVWSQVATSLPLPTEYREQLAEEISQQSDVTVGAAWSLEPELMPATLESDFAIDIRQLTVAKIQAVRPTVLESDKLFLLSVGGTNAEYVIRARELDCRTRIFGPVIVRRTRQPEQIATHAFRALTEAFAAMVRIESGQGNSLIVRVKCGGLVLDQQSPAHIAEGDILQPIVRQNDRLGQPAAITVVDWTFLRVTGRGETNPNLLEVQVHSAWQSPIRGRVSARREQYALAIRPTFAETELFIEADVPKGVDPYSLSGLEIYSKPPPAADTDTKKLSQFLGLTNWQGAIRIERTESPLQLVYVKNGGQLLARLPTVPGLTRELRVSIPDDDPRLQAEGGVQGFNGQLMDLIGHRQILASGIRKYIDEGRLTEAQTLVDVFTRLPTRTDMQRRLDQQLARQEKSPNRMVQARINVLYNEARKAVAKFVDPSLAGTLRRELQEAK